MLTQCVSSLTETSFGNVGHVPHALENAFGIHSRRVSIADRVCKQLVLNKRVFITFKNTATTHKTGRVSVPLAEGMLCRAQCATIPLGMNLPQVGSQCQLLALRGAWASGE